LFSNSFFFSCLFSRPLIACPPGLPASILLPAFCFCLTPFYCLSSSFTCHHPTACSPVLHVAILLHAPSSACRHTTVLPISKSACRPIQHPVPQSERCHLYCLVNSPSPGILLLALPLCLPLSYCLLSSCACRHPTACSLILIAVLILPALLSFPPYSPAACSPVLPAAILLSPLQFCMPLTYRLSCSACCSDIFAMIYSYAGNRYKICLSK
jgi:hypothetical protein